MEEDEDYAFGLTQIAWDKKQRKDLKIGFTFLGIVVLFVIGITVWFFA